MDDLRGPRRPRCTRNRRPTIAAAAMKNVAGSGTITTEPGGVEPGLDPSGTPPGPPPGKPPPPGTPPAPGMPPPPGHGGLNGSGIRPKSGPKPAGPANVILANWLAAAPSPPSPGPPASGAAAAPATPAADMAPAAGGIADCQRIIMIPPRAAEALKLAGDATSPRPRLPANRAAASNPVKAFWSRPVEPD